MRQEPEYYCEDCGLVLKFARRVVGGTGSTDPARWTISRKCPVCQAMRVFTLTTKEDR